MDDRSESQLVPDLWPILTPSISHSSSSDSDSDPISIPPGQTEVETLTVQIISALNDHNYTHQVFDRLVPNFRSDTEYIEGSQFCPQSKEQYLQKHRHWSRNVPTRTMRTLHTVTDFDEDKGKADVWLWAKVNGWGAGRMGAENVSCFKWKRSQGVWWCHSHTGMRGVTMIQCSC